MLFLQRFIGPAAIHAPDQADPDRSSLVAQYGGGHSAGEAQYYTSKRVLPCSRIFPRCLRLCVEKERERESRRAFDHLISRLYHDHAFSTCDSWASFYFLNSSKLKDTTRLLPDRNSRRATCASLAVVAKASAGGGAKGQEADLRFFQGFREIMTSQL